MGEVNFEKDLSIDKYALDMEAISMPSIYFRYADLVREAKSVVSEKKDNLSAITAETNIRIREEASQGGKKLTEKLVESMVDCDKEVLEAKKELRMAQADLDRLNVALSALETKKSEIDNLVKLFCSSYYANKEVKATGDFKAESTERYIRDTMSRL